MRTDLTDKQANVLAFIRHELENVGLPPTVRQVAQRFEISAKAAHDHLKAIARKGHIRLLPGSARGVVLVRKDAQEELPAIPDLQDTWMVEVPLLGSIAAGIPIPAVDRADTVSLPKSFIPDTGNIFALSVRGDSMIEAGILDGDIAVLQKCTDVSQVRNGEIVAIMLDQDVTLKRLERIAEGYRLLPANSNYAPILLTERSQPQIAGKLVGVYRRY